MEVLSNLKSAAAQAAGNVETAMLVIHDYRDAAEGSSGSSAGTQSLIEKLTSSILASGLLPSYSDNTDRIMQVKFNPSQLTINASATHLSKKNAEGPESRTISVKQANLNLTVMLFFDDMDTYDSFMWDKYVAGLSAAEGLAGAGKTVKRLAGRSKVHSVQPEVESLIAALRNPYTRLISFCWNDFTFTGSLNTVQAKYTMFSSSGRPVRAQVLLRILHNMKGSLLDGWYKSFDEAFGGETIDLVRAGQKVGNLLNLNL